MSEGHHPKTRHPGSQTFRLLALLGLLSLIQACSWSVIPPEPTAESATVYLSVYGRHTRLALPDESGHYVEYGFGDWRFYAEEQRTLFTGIQALFFSTGSTLSRRELPDPGQTDLRRHFLSIRTEAIEVPSHLARQLRDELMQNWEKAAGEQLSQGALVFRRAPRHYSLFHNSNHQTAQWLEQLQCDVQGAPFWSNFEVVAASKR